MTSPTEPVPAAPAGEPAATGPARALQRVRDREVVIAAAIAVGLVLGSQALGVFVPGFDDLLGIQPVVIIVLVVVTVVILVQAVRAGLRGR